MLPQVRLKLAAMVGVMDIGTPKRAIQPVRKECAMDVTMMSVNETTSGQRESGPHKAVGRLNLGRVEVVRQDQCVRE